MIKKIATFGLITLGIIFIFSSCNKEEKETALENSKSSDVAQNMYTDIFNEVSKTNQDIRDGQFKASATSGISEIPSCAVVTYILSNDKVFVYHPDSNYGHDEALYLKHVEIDYGTGCVQNGRTRKGKIIIDRNGKWYTQGTESVVTLENFSIDDYSIVGVKTVTTKEVTIQLVNPFVVASFDVDVAGGKITDPSGSMVIDNWISTRNGTWTIEDDGSGSVGVFFKLTGSAAGTNSAGENFTITILETLIAQAGCQWIKEGEFEIEGEENKITVNYGDGTCDDQATYAINNGKKREFTLRQ